MAQYNMNVYTKGIHFLLFTLDQTRLEAIWFSFRIDLLLIMKTIKTSIRTRRAYRLYMSGKISNGNIELKINNNNSHYFIV